MGDLVLGVDLGFTRNNPMAIVLLEQGVDVSKLWEHYTYEPDISVEWQTRLVDIGRWLDDYISAQNTNGTRIDLLAYELPFTHPANRQVGIMLAHLGGMIVTLAWQHSLPFICVAPAQAKCGLAGKGKAEKWEMIAAAKRRWDVELCKDEADASGIAYAGWCIHNDRDYSLSK